MTDPSTARNDVRTFVRNRWFTGKLLDAYHMQLETDSVIHKRWLLNRLVLGSGVALGLDVRHADHDPLSFVVTPGLAIDWHGREIIVPKQTAPCKIDDAVLAAAIDHQLGQAKHEQKQQRQQKQGQRGGKGEAESPDRVWLQLLIGYRETQGDPVPADFGDCGGGACVPGSTYEGYEIHFAPAPAEKPPCQCHIPDLRDADPSDYHRVLAHWVTRHRPARELVPRKDPSLALANVAVEVDDQGQVCPGKGAIDIAVRDVVYYNDLLFQLILGLAEAPSQQGGK